jgi:hypothetical protein
MKRGNKMKNKNLTKNMKWNIFTVTTAITIGVSTFAVLKYNTRNTKSDSILLKAENMILSVAETEENNRGYRKLDNTP